MPWIHLWQAHKSTQRNLKQWNHQVFGHFPTQIQQTQNQISALEEKTSLNPEEWSQLELLHASMHNLVEREEAFLAQQASQQTFLDGDRNTKFFHAVIKKKRMRNHISTTQLDNGNLTSDPQLITQSAIDYFSTLMQQKQQRTSPLHMDFSLLHGSKEKLQEKFLTYPPSMAETLQTLKEMKAFKAAGSDGFTAHFYQTTWHIIGDHIQSAITDFFKGGKIHPFFLDTTLILIPKTTKPLHWSGYRPIALTSVLTRLISKILTNRLSPLMEDLIEPNQAAFVEGRQIMDNIIIAQELCRDLELKTRGGNIILKLDIRKAFDTMEWDFLLQNLAARGFQPHLLQLCQQLLSGSNYSILLNGSKQGYFRALRGVKQGDPLSPFLFILGMDYLSKRLNQLFQNNPRMQYKQKGKQPINHLIFADDLLIFCNGTKDSLRRLMKELEAFQKLSGMFFNTNKCIFIAGKTTKPQRVQWIQHFTGFSPSSLPLSYLGAQIFKGRASKVGESIINSIKSKIQSWEHSFLSSGARITLIQSTLNSLPIYTMQAQQLNKGTINKIERVLNKFVWSYAKRGIHWASWKKLAKPRAVGGLGLRSLHELYENFSIKRWVRFREQKSLWARFMVDRYCTKHTPLEVQLLRGDSPTWRRMLEARAKAEEYLFWIAGKGNFNLWTDHWLGNATLGSSFPDLAEQMPQLKVASLITNGEWDFSWAGQHLNEDILQLLKQLPPPNAEDQLKLKGTSRNKTFSKVLHLNAWSNAPHTPNRTYGWNKYLKPSILFFGWKLNYQLLPLDNILKLKGIKICSRCNLCLKEEESPTHLFNSCEFTQKVLLLLGCSMVFPDSNIPEASKPPMLHTTWRGKHKRTLGLLICWFIWCARNQNKNEETKTKPTTCHIHIWSYLSKIVKGATNHILDPQDLSHFRLSKWLPPMGGGIKINVDAHFADPTRNAGVGGLFRDCHGKILLHFSAPMVALSPLHAEAQALLIACIICKSIHGKSIWIETDSLQLVQHLLVYNDLDPPWYLIHILKRIKHQLSTQQIYLSHNFREANRPADFLASLGATLSSFSISKTTLRDLQLLAHGDLIGLPHLRLG